jgi:uncharacterized membrane protein YgdD (TMEM256/DUF423 family)
MEKNGIFLASFFGATAIVFGAFGAHSIGNHLNMQSLNVYETAVKYQMYHALFLLIVSQNKSVTDATKKNIFWVITIGVFMFSGSLYLLSTNAITTFDFKFLGPITPIGGMLLILGWLILLRSVFSKKA